MARKIPEWIGKTDNSAIPDRVKLRLWGKSAGHCQSCARKIMAGEIKHFDHVIPLADGGQHSEANLQVLCLPCHGGKTSDEAGARARARSKTKAVLGIKRAKGSVKSAGFPKIGKGKAPQSKSLPPRPLYERVR